MIHRLSHNTAYVLLNHQLICKDDIEHATFFVENCYLKIISFVVTIVISVVTGSFPGLMLFYVFYSMIRRHSGGFHCKTQAGCLLLSVVVLLVVVATKPIALDIVKDIFWWVLMISALIILLIGTVNHPNLNLTKEELNVSKRKARLVTVLEISFIVLSIFLHIQSEYIFYMFIGIAVNAISMIVSKLIGQEVTAE